MDTNAVFILLAEPFGLDDRRDIFGELVLQEVPQNFCLLDVPNGYQAFLAGLASPLDALPWAVSSSCSTEQRPSSRPDLHTPRQRAQ